MCVNCLASTLWYPFSIMFLFSAPPPFFFFNIPHRNFLRFTTGLAWALFVLMFLTLLCYLPTELILGFFVHKFSNFTPQNPDYLTDILTIVLERKTRLYAAKVLGCIIHSTYGLQNYRRVEGGGGKQTYMNISDGIQCCRSDWLGVCLVVDPHVLSANKVDLGFFFFCFINFQLFPTELIWAFFLFHKFINVSLEWWDAVLQKRLACLLLSTRVCCRLPKELIWAFFVS